jgi:pimeloyl-ACP methyl ester carboxylesterase
MMAAYVDDVIAVLRDLNIDDFVCWGYSMGGQTALSLAVTHPDRLKALVVTGAEIDPWSPREEYEEMLAAIEAEGMEVVASDFDTPEDPLPDWYRRLSLETDAEAFAASVGARLEWPGVTQDVEKIKMPTLFMGGEYEDDPGELESMAQKVPRGAAEKVEGVGHIGVFARSDLVLPRLTSFLDRSLS